MNTPQDMHPGSNGPDVVISQESLSKAEEFIEAEEGAANKFKGWAAGLVTLLAVEMSWFHLYTASAMVSTQSFGHIPVGLVWF